MKKKILLIVSGSQEKNSWYNKYFDPDHYSWDTCFLETEKTFTMILRMFWKPKNINNYDLVVSVGIGYCIAFAVALRLKLLKNKPKHLAYSFVQTRRLFKTRFKFINNIINNIFNRCDKFITHSNIERKLLSEAHNLPIDKFHFMHWGHDLPKIYDTEFSKRNKPYVCMIGRVNRDFHSFSEAIKGLDVDGVIICPSYLNLDIKETEQLKIYNDLSMNECLDCIKHSAANLVLVNHGNSGAGHITLVYSMLLGKPQIVSNVETVADYFINCDHGLSVPIGDVNEIRNAIRLVINWSDYGYKSYGYKAIKEFALKHFTDEAVYLNLKDVVDELVA